MKKLPSNVDTLEKLKKFSFTALTAQKLQSSKSFVEIWPFNNFSMYISDQNSLTC